MSEQQAFRKGAQYVLSYLQELFEGIEETDIWDDFMKDED